MSGVHGGALAGHNGLFHHQRYLRVSLMLFDRFEEKENELTIYLTELRN